MNGINTVSDPSKILLLILIMVVSFVLTAPDSAGYNFSSVTCAGITGFATSFIGDKPICVITKTTNAVYNNVITITNQIKG